MKSAKIAGYAVKRFCTTWGIFMSPNAGHVWNATSQNLEYRTFVPGLIGDEYRPIKADLDRARAQVRSW